MSKFSFFLCSAIQSLYLIARRPCRRFIFYFNSLFWLYLTPSIVSTFKKDKFKKLLSNPLLQKKLRKRLDYYFKGQEPFKLCNGLSVINRHISSKTMASSYFIDFKSILRLFPARLSSHYLMGDQRKIPNNFTFIKSRPITSSHENSKSVILKLNQIRHYFFLRDQLPFLEKKDLFVWRGGCFNKQRALLLKRYFEHPSFNIGQSNRKKEPYYKGFLSMGQQLTYKFIISLEGNDVASNLKWLLSSSSLCFMPKPRFETWFMEGTLKADVHYVEIADDLSNLEEKRRYYLAHPQDALTIIAQANDFVSQFKNKEHEDCLSYLVAEKYFYLSGQYPKALFKEFY